MRLTRFDFPQGFLFGAATAARWDAIFDRWFIEAITKGVDPTEASAGLAPYLALGWQDDMATIAQAINWLGVNYDTRHITADAASAQWPAIRDVPGPMPKTQMGWQIYPKGLETFLTRSARDHVGQIPLYRTENGMANADVGERDAVSDQIREDCLFAQLAAITEAIAAGANVKGIFYWSHLDDYEWAEGDDKRFGLVPVDFATQGRTPESSHHADARALARNQ